MLSTQNFTTEGNILVHYRETPLDILGALSPVHAAIDTHKGAVFSSGFDYPGRHSRWDIGFVDPALELVGYARSFAVRALNAQGQALLPIIQRTLVKHPHVEELIAESSTLSGSVVASSSFFSEETRSRQPSIFSVIRALIALFKTKSEPAAHFGLYGAFGYDLIHQFEPIKLRHNRDPEQKTIHLYLPLQLYVVDRKKEVASLIEYSIDTESGLTENLPGGGETFTYQRGQGDGSVRCDHEPGKFAQNVKSIIEGTKRGDYFEVVLSQSFSSDITATPTALFDRLCKVNPSPYLFLINLGKEQLIGSSPEIFARVSGRRYETCPISGTAQRGDSALEDADQVKALINSEKEESELTMCTDVDRNDMARVCEPGSVTIIGRRQLEFYSHLIHTVDHLQGTLREDFDALDAFQTHMWACTVTGSPKPAAVQAIEDLEASPRGWYSGAVGYLSFDGDLNTGITLRTAHVQNGVATIRAGATLLFGCDPDKEEQETRTKAAAFLSVLRDARNTAVSPNPVALPLRVSDLKVLLVDHRDSFVHNLATYLRELGCTVTTVRYDFPESLLDDIDPDLLFLSPGPGTPSDFRISHRIDSAIKRQLPVFGVCLGHQGIGEYFGGTLGILDTPCHGKSSLIRHTGDLVFAGLPEEFVAGRYHSLYIKPGSVPACLDVIADTEASENGQIVRIPMAVRHKTLPIIGVQFHPESLMTMRKHAGHTLLANSLQYFQSIQKG